MGTACDRLACDSVRLSDTRTKKRRNPVNYIQHFQTEANSTRHTSRHSTRTSPHPAQREQGGAHGRRAIIRRRSPRRRPRGPQRRGRRKRPPHQRRQTHHPTHPRTNSEPPNHAEGSQGPDAPPQCWEGVRGRSSSTRHGELRVRAQENVRRSTTVEMQLKIRQDENRTPAADSRPRECEGKRCSRILRG